MAPAAASAFLASLVEFVEALTIVLAVGTMRGWRPALSGAAAATVLLGLAVLLCGPLLGRLPIGPLQLATGVLLLLFGMRWLRKAILRAAGILALHDEMAAFARARGRLEPARGLDRIDGIAFATAFKAVLLEGAEVVFIVLAVGAGGRMLLPAALGALAAAVLVVALGVVVHRPLARVPENTLKFAVGVMLSAFGLFWVGEGLGFAWPAGELSIPILATLLLGVALGLVAAIRQSGRGHRLERAR